MKDPVSVLSGEHSVLMGSIASARKLLEEKDDHQFHQQCKDYILFLRNYTEIYHFPKEENIFYPLLQGRSDNTDEEFVRELSDNHEDLKALMAEIEDCYGMNDYRRLRSVFSNYLAELESHITTEDKIVLSRAGKMLTEKEAGNVSEEFRLHDEKHGEKEEMEERIMKTASGLM